MSRRGARLGLGVWERRWERGRDLAAGGGGVGFGDVNVFGFGAEVDDGLDVVVVGEKGAVNRGGGVWTSGAVEDVGLEGGRGGEGVDRSADVAEVEDVFELGWGRHGRLWCRIKTRQEPCVRVVVRSNRTMQCPSVGIQLRWAFAS